MQSSLEFHHLLHCNNQNLKYFNPDKSNILYHFDKLDFKTAIIKDGETEAVGFFISDPPFDKYLLDINKKATKKTLKINGFYALSNEAFFSKIIQ